jgi:thiosulfate/3-mercaptopyruvate sulfurtransferase
MKKLEELLSRTGIDNKTTIVLYGDNNNWFAAWAYWQLKLFGVEDVRILNGGRKLWLAEGRPTSTDVPAYQPTGIRLPEADFSHRAFRDDVLRQVESDGALVDVRSPAEFAGELLAPAALPQEGAQRAGHVPGAANIPWGQAVNEDGTFKRADELRELYAAKGITADRDVIAYCRIGERSSHTWFVLHELLGFERVRNYDGSWTEYGSLVGVPIEKEAKVAVPA